MLTSAHMVHNSGLINKHPQPKWCHRRVFPVLQSSLLLGTSVKKSIWPPPLVLLARVSSCVFLLSCCSPALRRPLVQFLCGSVCPAWPGAVGLFARPCPGQSCLSLSTLHHRFLLALSPAWQRCFPFLILSPPFCPGMFSCGSEWDREAAFGIMRRFPHDIYAGTPSYLHM